MKPPPINFEYCIYDEGQEHYSETELVTRWELCQTCEGEGTQALYGMDVTDCIREDPDFGEYYMRGHYDTPCSQCKGRRVVAVIDRERNDPELVQAYDDQQQAIAEMNAEAEAERRMGA